MHTETYTAIDTLMKFQTPFENIHEQFKEKNENGKLPGAFQLPNAPVSAAPEPKPFRPKSPRKRRKVAYN
jgi:hypothetical protein